MQLLIFSIFTLCVNLPICLMCIDHTLASQSYAPHLRILCFLQQQLDSCQLGVLHPSYPFGWWAQMDVWLFGATHQVTTPFNPSPCRALVGSNGLGPSTSRLSGVCSNQLSYEPISRFSFLLRRSGGGNRVRTDDPLLAGQVLYQLSYTPIPLKKMLP